MVDSPLFAYRAAVREGLLRADPAQQLAAEKLQSLHLALTNYHPKQGATGWLGRFGRNAQKQNFGWSPGDAVGHDPKQGLYMFGNVGSGKSMLMDLFYQHSAVTSKRRIHFHELMQSIHHQIHAWRSVRQRSTSDPIPQIARDIAAQSWLLCLDELQVTDIGDAMIVGRLFKALIDLGVVMVITSNRAPDDLYKDGLQRDRFLPFIHLLNTKLDLLQLDAATDYRLGRTQGNPVYHSPLNDQTKSKMDQIFKDLAGGAPVRESQIVINQRTLSVPRATEHVARFDFSDLCAHALGAADYLALAQRYPMLMLDNIPTLSAANHNEAKRFVTLIDALYEAKTLLICSAEAPPETLYPEGAGAFEFQRTVSRLMEMQSQTYLKLSHDTHP